MNTTTNCSLFRVLCDYLEVYIRYFYFLFTIPKPNIVTNRVRYMLEKKMYIISIIYIGYLFMHIYIVVNSYSIILVKKFKNIFLTYSINNRYITLHISTHKLRIYSHAYNDFKI